MHLRGSKKSQISVIVALAISVLTLSLVDIDASAHSRYTTSKKGEKEIGHDNELELILFGKDYGYKQSQSRPQSIKAIEDATYLCIDLFENGADSVGEEELTNLISQGVYLPIMAPALSSFNYADTGHHRIHTHEGWNFKYPESVIDNAGNESDWQEVWRIRKNILRDTVRHEFGFLPLVSNINGDAAVIDHFAEMIYYIHLLGDIESTKGLDAYKKQPVMLLAYNHATADKSVYPDIICELKDCFEVIFADSKETSEYTQLMNDLDKYHQKAQLYTNSPASYSYHFYDDQVVIYGTIPDGNRFTKYQKTTAEFIEKVLMKRIPELLRSAEFYQNSALYEEINNN